jgi:anti-sigma B factor antagonist
VISLDFHHRSDHLLIVLSGELDMHSSQAFRQQVADLMPASRETVVLDLSGLHFVDSSGVGALLAVVRLPAEQRPRVVLDPAQRPLTRLMRTTHLDTLLPVYPTVEAALAAPVRSAA